MRSLILFLFTVGPILLFGQGTIDGLVASFTQKKYSETLAQAKLKRNSARASELAAIDLIIACSYCLDSPTPTRGKAMLDKITNNYRLNRKQESAVQRIRAACGQQNATVTLPELDMVKAVREMDRVSVRGGSAKTGWELTLVGPDQYITIDAAATAPALSPTHDRSFALGEQKAAIDYYDGLYPRKAKQVATDHFLISSLSKSSRKNLRRLGDRLDNLLQAYAQYYGFELPGGLITIHVVADHADMNRLSKAIYGFEMGSDNRGYSDINNRSMLIKTPNPVRFQGTIQHELMHLLVNYNTTLPPWLSEGMPALYEATTGDGLIGVENWRKKILRETFPKQSRSAGPQEEYLSPRLFEMNWNEFDAFETTDNENQVRLDRLQQAINHAAARYFVLFLQEKGKLKDTVAAFANYHYGDPSFEDYENNVQVVEAVTGQAMDDLWTEFTQWLDR